MIDLRKLEKSFAYEQAASLIESSCAMDVVDEEAWYDLSSSDIDLSDEAAYLSARGLLRRRGDSSAWVNVCDEDEPQAPVAQEFSAECSERAPSQLDRIEAATKSILEEIHRMADNQEQLDNELSTVETDLAALGTELTTTITDLQAKASGSSIDFTPEVTRLSAIATTLTSLTATAAAADPGAPANAANAAPAQSAS